ncbi:MAG: prepilin-type N-terminal cleavage/methylation domain-containing protein [Elusimicrobia bacterium]|nr:prepilin-type N-terminal cleavage/methylation domain-containing protein [Elusimicrobiota bacterium]
MRKAGSFGFTLIELMIVVAIIGILAAIAIPKFGQLVNKSKEGATKGSLGALRSALSIYYGDMEGTYPSTIEGLTISGKYLTALPFAKTPGYHADSDGEVADSGVLAVTDAGGWAYNNQTGDANFGTVWVNCTHTDAKSTTWTAY